MGKETLIWIKFCTVVDRHDIITDDSGFLAMCGEGPYFFIDIFKHYLKTYFLLVINYSMLLAHSHQELCDCALYKLGICKLEIFVRIESRIESGYSRLRVIIIITDEQRCADSLGSSNNIARSLQC